MKLTDILQICSLVTTAYKKGIPKTFRFEDALESATYPLLQFCTGIPLPVATLVQHFT